MFQQMTEICLKGLSFLVTQDRGQIVQSRQIGEKLGISPTYVAKAFQPVARQGWLRSIKGRAGGWVLEVDPTTVKVADVVRACEPNDEWRRCVVGHVICNGETDCAFHNTWHKAVLEFGEILEQRSVAELPQFLPPCFEKNYPLPKLEEPIVESDIAPPAESA